jgi:hypothetical protein
VTGPIRIITIIMFNMLRMDNAVVIDNYRSGISVFSLSLFQYFATKSEK